MNLIDTLAVIALLIDFLIGAVAGIFVTVCAAVLTEDRRRHGLRDRPRDAAEAGTRKFVGAYYRDGHPGHFPRGPRDQGWGPGQ
ncbi:MAG TPA: hypothetical protein VH478_05830 [Trebonia sp.]|jgi:hypothetical protein|nr:hypothetical protein [Trebonia sp.]